MNPEELRELEQRTFRAAVDDGFWDILLGMHFVIIGTSISAGLETPLIGAIGGAFGASILPLHWYLRRALITPRIGHFRLNEARRSRIRWAHFVAVALIVVVVITAGLWLNDRFPGLFPMLVFVLPLAACGYFLEIRRHYFYAAVLAIERSLDAASGSPYDWMFWPTGVIVIATGAIVIAQFFKQYPPFSDGVQG